MSAHFYGLNYCKKMGCRQVKSYLSDYLSVLVWDFLRFLSDKYSQVLSQVTFYLTDFSLYSFFLSINIYQTSKTSKTLEEVRRKSPPPCVYHPTESKTSSLWRKKGKVPLTQKKTQNSFPCHNKNLTKFLCQGNMAIMRSEENSWSENWSDRTLLDYLLFTTKFTQEELAKRLGFNRSQISKVLHSKRKLRPAVRHLALELCKKLDEGQPI